MSKAVGERDRSLCVCRANWQIHDVLESELSFPISLLIRQQAVRLVSVYPYCEGK
jgi:hypothetical protein